MQNKLGRGGGRRRKSEEGKSVSARREAEHVN
jgi:hypothetical protein